MTPPDVLRRSLAAPATALTRPLVLSQAAASAAGAFVVLLGAWHMEPAEFASFSLALLVLNVGTGLVRSGLFQPALIERRTDPHAVVPARYVVVAAGAVAVLVAAADLAVTALAAGGAVALGSLSVAPVVQDWLRFRCIGQGRNGAVALSDGVRLLLVPAVLLVSGSSQPLVAFYAVWCAAYAVAAVPLALAARRVDRYSRYAGYGARARSQAYEFLVAQLATTVPLLVLGALSVSASIGAFRLSQTLYGPVNVLFAAVALNLLSDAVGTADRPDDATLVRRARRLGLLSAGGATVLGVALVVVAAAGAVHPSGIERGELAVALAAVGCFAACGGLVGPHLVVMRIFKAQSVVTRARVGMVAVTWCGFVLGYLAGGPFSSLVLGFVLGGAGYVAFFLPAAVRTYRGVAV
ncbi:hypothetical protein [Cellulosimicrobium funkei]|uniref:Polysaccharide biosynthesis protein n=1 Tax=Cellulosimicrobium funkei TaxID=264251 RepID=A0A4Y8R5A5_9MICO|nr:hypothetical protein [Cellulosimicrobium funkei]TFF16782.1 hypothetical protein E1O70_05365 [Cellulosimicrobium funkei]TGA78388.1 hypothetical protein EQW79_000525 [Cellulosimicrobium terreum]